MSQNPRNKAMLYDYHEDGIIDVDDLTEKEWSEIRFIARELYEEGFYDGNQFMIACRALVEWLSINDLGMQSMRETMKKIH